MAIQMPRLDFSISLMAELNRMPAYEAEKLGYVRHFFQLSIRKYMYVCMFVFSSLAPTARDGPVTFAHENAFKPATLLKTHDRIAALAFCSYCRRSLTSIIGLEAERYGFVERPLSVLEPIDRETQAASTARLGHQR